MAVVLKPLTPDLWPALEDLFGPKGAHGGCWCMWWRIPGPRKAYQERVGQPNHDAFEQVVAKGPPPGLIAFDDDGRPVGWVNIGPRRLYPRFNAARSSAPVEAGDAEDPQVWAINCFFVRSGARRAGLMRVLIDGAVAYARERGARVLEAAPLDVERKLIWGEGYVGVASTFRAAGFRSVTNRSQSRPLMRLDLVPQDIA
jgi:GNAT superfamily N-acetyltransferase